MTRTGGRAGGRAPETAERRECECSLRQHRRCGRVNAARQRAVTDYRGRRVIDLSTPDAVVLR